MTQVRLQDDTISWSARGLPKSEDILTVQGALYSIIHSLVEWAAVGISLFTSFIALMLMLPRGVEEICSGKTDYWKIIRRQLQNKRSPHKVENMEQTVNIENATVGSTPVKNKEEPQDEERCTSSTEIHEASISPNSTKSQPDSGNVPSNPATSSESTSPDSTKSQTDSGNVPSNPATPSEKSSTPIESEVSPFRSEPSADASDRVDESQKVVPKLLDEAAENTVSSEPSKN